MQTGGGTMRSALCSVKLTVIGLHIHIQKTLFNILPINMIRPKIPSSMSVMFDSVKNCDTNGHRYQ